MPLTGQSRFKHFEPVHNTIVLVHYNNILEDIMKKLSKLLLCAVLISSIFTGCTGNFSSSQNSGRLKIVSTIFPSYDFARAIAGENAAIEQYYQQTRWIKDPYIVEMLKRIICDEERHIVIFCQLYEQTCKK